MTLLLKKKYMVKLKIIVTIAIISLLSAAWYVDIQKSEVKVVIKNENTEMNLNKKKPNTEILQDIIESRKDADRELNNLDSDELSLRYNYSENKSWESNDSRSRLFTYLSSLDNRNSVMKAALEENNFEPRNACVYFVGEVLRRINVGINKGTYNTKTLKTLLEMSGYKKEYDLSKIRAGDVCFTTDALGDKNGEPTHTFIFMGWIDKVNGVANVCDNQSYDYGTVYHARNIFSKSIYKGTIKEATAYFMYSEK